MSKQFRWVSEVERARWLTAMEDEEFSSVMSIVPSGFEAYARVFHPVERDRPHGPQTWTGIDEETYFESAVNIGESLERQRVQWSSVAQSFGTTMHGSAQYCRLVGGEDGADGGIAPDGWRYGQTDQGNLDVPSLAALSAVLARHTSTPDAGIAAIWEGWGGLMSSGGSMELRFYGPAESTGLAGLGSRFTAALAQRIWNVRSAIKSHPWFNHSEPKPGTGVLSAQIANGPKFGLHADTGRSYVLFEAGAHDFTDTTWPERAPWIDEPMWPQSPSILWPDDHAWVLGTEIDFDSTLIAGSAALIQELVKTPGLEVLPISTDIDLSWAGDTVNPRA